ncbi:MAG: hypothetical protein WDW38_003114 [Sanguina aurantia]
MSWFLKGEERNQRGPPLRVVKVACRGVVVLLLSPAVAPLVDPVSILRSLMRDIAAGQKPRCKFGERIVPLATTCGLEAEQLTSAVSKLALHHQASHAYTSRLQHLEPIQFAVAYKGRTAESKAFTKKDSTEAGSNQANDSLQDPRADDSAPAADQSDLLPPSSTTASNLQTAAGIAAPSTSAGPHTSGSVSAADAAPCKKKAAGVTQRGAASAPSRGAVINAVVAGLQQVFPDVKTMAADGGATSSNAGCSTVNLHSPQVAIFCEAIPLGGDMVCVGLCVLDAPMFDTKPKLVTKSLNITP